MQASKSSGHAARFDTFECLTCDTKIVEAPGHATGKNGSGNSKS
ncbi:replication endonuclease [Pseudolabrys taiwanensis]|nr:replication endonuclease [Pseudolabrys taiwanensis]